MVSVKLVSEPGVGTIVAGGKKPMLTLLPFQVMTVVQQHLHFHRFTMQVRLGNLVYLKRKHFDVNDLRGKVRVQTDGGLKTGLDVG